MLTNRSSSFLAMPGAYRTSPASMTASWPIVHQHNIQSYSPMPATTRHPSLSALGASRPPSGPYQGFRESSPSPELLRWTELNQSGHDQFSGSPDSSQYHSEDIQVGSSAHRGVENARGIARYHSQRKPSNRDEFDGPHQLLQPPSPRTLAEQERDLPHLPTNLDVQEQDQVLGKVNDILSKCAFDFVAKYQFPIPTEPDKRPVRLPSDREWTEWVYLLKRLATKRRIPARVLHNQQIKQLVTTLENSAEMRHAAKHQSRPLKDDRNVLQLISAGTQVAKILKDATAMEQLDRLYIATESHIHEWKERHRRGMIF